MYFDEVEVVSNDDFVRIPDRFRWQHDEKDGDFILGFAHEVNTRLSGKYCRAVVAVLNAIYERLYCSSASRALSDGEKKVLAYEDTNRYAHHDAIRRETKFVLGELRNRNESLKSNLFWPHHTNQFVQWWSSIFERLFWDGLRFPMIPSDAGAWFDVQYLIDTDKMGRFAFPCFHSFPSSDADFHASQNDEHLILAYLFKKVKRESFGPSPSIAQSTLPYPISYYIGEPFYGIRKALSFFERTNESHRMFFPSVDHFDPFLRLEHTAAFLDQIYCEVEPNWGNDKHIKGKAHYSAAGKFSPVIPRALSIGESVTLESPIPFNDLSFDEESYWVEDRYEYYYPAYSRLEIGVVMREGKSEPIGTYDSPRMAVVLDEKSIRRMAETIGIPEGLSVLRVFERSDGNLDYIKPGETVMRTYYTPPITFDGIYSDVGVGFGFSADFSIYYSTLDGFEYDTEGTGTLKPLVPVDRSMIDSLEVGGLISRGAECSGYDDPRGIVNDYADKPYSFFSFRGKTVDDIQLSAKKYFEQEVRNLVEGLKNATGFDIYEGKLAPVFMIRGRLSDMRVTGYRVASTTVHGRPYEYRITLSKSGTTPITIESMERKIAGSESDYEPCPIGITYARVWLAPIVTGSTRFSEWSFNSDLNLATIFKSYLKVKNYRKNGQ